MADLVLVESRPGYRVVVLNRPERLNAFDDAMHGALTAALDDAAADPGCRALLLTGAGRGFCAGQDLGARIRSEGDPPPDLGATLERFYNPLVRRLAAMRVPVVCAVNGVAAGAGANIALVCDVVFAARSARFIQSFSRIGLVPDCGGTFVLPRRVGTARATALMLLAEPISAEQAADWGMIWRCVDDEALMRDAEAATARLAAQPKEGLALIKDALRASPSNTLDLQLDLERDLQRQAGRTDDYAEGVRAFVEKRPPVFKDRSPWTGSTGSRPPGAT